jgi:DNA polymerase-3 subunit epsilon
MIVIDIETTGFDPATNHIVDIALVEINEGGVVVSEWTSKVRSIRIDERGLLMDPLSKIHGITAIEAALAPSWKSIGQVVAQRLRGQVVVGHNANGFDVPFLRTALERIGIRLEIAGVIDTLDQDRASRRTPGRHRLGDACAAWGIPLTNAHRALPDAQATAALAVRQAALLGWSGYTSG